MTKLIACFAVLGALLAFTPAPAGAATANDGVSNSAPAVVHDEISARRYYYYYRPYRYYRPRYYYRPYYYRPYRYYYY